MSQRYIVTDKTTGKELLNMEFTKADEAVEEIRKLFASGIKPDGIDVKIDPGNDLPPVPVTPEQLKKMGRKSRSNIGQPHSKKQESGKQIRNRGWFFGAERINVTICKTRQDLEKYLDTLHGDFIIMQGHELKFERKIQFTLKAVK